ncbi:MAG: flagellar export chaperone FlgN [Oligoflexia bacterium]|jgi:hypothetical protein
MEKNLTDLYQQLQKLLTLHRQLLETLRLEREALVAANIAQIEDMALAKQAVLDQIERADTLRRKLSDSLAASVSIEPARLKLSQVAIIAQGIQVRLGEQFRSVQQALSHVLTKVEEQGEYNRQLVEQSLETVVQMKRNILGAEAPRAGTYSPRGQQATNNTGARLLSKEI